MPARISVVIEPQLLGERRMRDVQLVAGLHDRLVDAGARLDADDHQIERVRQPVPNLLLAQRGLPAEPHARQHVAERRRRAARSTTARSRTTMQRQTADDERQQQLRPRRRRPRPSGCDSRRSPAGGAAASCPSATSARPAGTASARGSAFPCRFSCARTPSAAELRQPPDLALLRRAPGRARTTPAPRRPARPTQTPRSEPTEIEDIRALTAASDVSRAACECPQYSMSTSLRMMNMPMTCSDQRADDHLDAERIRVELAICLRAREREEQRQADAAAPTGSSR